LRAIYDFDEDFKALHQKTTIAEYLSTAWIDFQRGQVEQFGAMPFFWASAITKLFPRRPVMSLWLLSPIG
jgi:hypothetical protein